MKHPYEDILRLPHHRSEKRSPMSLQDRAAQFSPFAALTGFDGVIQETGRLTLRQVDLDESAVAALDRMLQQIGREIHLEPVVTAVYFVPDRYKEGGSYTQKTGPVKGLDKLEQCLIFTDGTRIFFEQLRELTLGEESCVFPDNGSTVCDN